MGIQAVLDLPQEVIYVLLLFALFVVPRLLQRFRLPTAITALALGVLAGVFVPDLRTDGTVSLLSTLGIVSLFLFAGLDIEFHDLKRESRAIGHHLVFQIVLLLGIAAGLMYALDLGPRVSALVALGLLTPSTGFILDSLASFGLTERESFWVRSKAIATELVALVVLFVTLQSTSLEQFGIATGALVAMIALLPIVFRVFAQVVAPHAPKSEFGFLVMVAVVCALGTRHLGVYYLVGAFVVGMAAQRFRARLPAIASDKMLHSVEAFSSFFVPFYFFHAGLEIEVAEFGLDWLLAGAAFLVVGIPVRLFVGGFHRIWMLRDSFRESMRVHVPMLPTLVFTLVVADILRERFEVPSYVVGGLVVYTIANTLIPALVLRVQLPEFEDHLLPTTWTTMDEAGEGPARGG